jgi:hypothetical protein
VPWYPVNCFLRTALDEKEGYVTMNSDVLLSGQFAELYAYLTDEDRFGPGPTLGRVTCDHTLHYTLAWMKEHRVQNPRANIEKIVDLGGHCDCEVLLNVAPEVWEERREEEITGPDIMGESQWQQCISDLLSESGIEAGEQG